MYTQLSFSEEKGVSLPLNSQMLGISVVTDKAKEERVRCFSAEWRVES